MGRKIPRPEAAVKWKSSAPDPERRYGILRGIMQNKVTVLDHPLLRHKLGYLRDKNTSSSDFRELVKEISRILAHEVMRDWKEMSMVAIETPIAPTTV